MAIVGIGVDVVEIRRLGAAMERAPRLRERLFAPAERDLPLESLAARFAAKEAVAKALGSPGSLSWQDAIVHRAPGSAPRLEVVGSVAARALALGVVRWHVSLSHDGGIATAMVVAES